MNYTSTQPTADQLKRLIDQVKNADQRGPALAALRDFENADWHPRVFMAAIKSTPGTFGFDGDRITGYTPPTKQPLINAADAVTLFVREYLREIDYINGTPSADEAADDAQPDNIIRLQTT